MMSHVVEGRVQVFEEVVFRACLIDDEVGA